MRALIVERSQLSMKPVILALLALLAPLSARAVSSISASNVYFAPDNTLADGTTQIPEGFHFDLGTFDNGFVPTAANESSWLANWTLAPTGTSSYSTAVDGFTISSTLTSNTAPFATSNLGYIWGYDNQTYAPDDEWILFSNQNNSNTDPTSWVWPAVIVTPDEVTWSSGSDSDGTDTRADDVVVGEIKLDGGMELAAIDVPEPSTVPLAAVGLAGLLGLRSLLTRKKKAGRYWRSLRVPSGCCTGLPAARGGDSKWALLLSGRWECGLS